ncbi:MAG: hypothetical protein ABIF18_03625 [archaeon]
MTNLLIIANKESLKEVGLEEMDIDCSRLCSGTSIFMRARLSVIKYGREFAERNGYELVVVTDLKESLSGRKYEARLDFYYLSNDE